MRHLSIAAVLALSLLTSPAEAEEPSTLASVAGAQLLDAGVMEIGPTGPFARTETFELLRLADGNHVLLNTITAGNGAYRVRVRFDLDADFNSIAAYGRGLYDGVPVQNTMRREGERVAITVRGEGIDLSPSAVCEPDCLINMSPSATAMFFMTRHYDHQAGGEQRFRWAGQDLDRLRTLDGGKADLTYRGDVAVPRWDGSEMTIRHYTFVESLPLADGGYFTLDFDLWTDADANPMGFRVITAADRPPVIGFRLGYDDVKAALLVR